MTQALKLSPAGQPLVLSYMDTGGKIAIDQVAAGFGMSKGQLAETAGLARETGSIILDVAALAERIGTDAWFDPVQHFAYKLPFAAECALAYADLLGRLLGAIRGKARKCLVLDLHNTMWGGVIGDDGLEAIVVGQGSALGEAAAHAAACAGFDLAATLSLLMNHGALCALTLPEETAP